MATNQSERLSDEQLAALFKRARVTREQLAHPYTLTMELSRALEAERAEVKRLEKTLDQYRWRPIGEIHEDLGPCVLLRLDDPGYMEVGSNVDEDFNEPGWTHFAEVPKLTHEEAERLRGGV